MERHNRKSHLAPQLSPSTQALLRGENVASPSKESSASKTPTSGEIPIAGDDMKPSPPSDAPATPAISRAMSTDVNGAGNYHPPSTVFDRPIFPPRTSSSSTVLPLRPRESDSFITAGVLHNRPKDTDNLNITSVLPIRPAPPPSGPLPPPPGASLRSPALRRQAINGIAYTNGESSQY